VHSVFPRTSLQNYDLSIISLWSAKIFWTVFHGARPARGFPAAYFGGPRRHHSLPLHRVVGGLPQRLVLIQKDAENLSGRGLRHGERAFVARRCCYYWQRHAAICHMMEPSLSDIVDVHSIRNGFARKGDLGHRRTRYV